MNRVRSSFQSSVSSGRSASGTSRPCASRSHDVVERALLRPSVRRTTRTSGADSRGSRLRPVHGRHDGRRRRARPQAAQPRPARPAGAGRRRATPRRIEDDVVLAARIEREQRHEADGRAQWRTRPATGSGALRRGAAFHRHAQERGPFLVGEIRRCTARTDRGGDAGHFDRGLLRDSSVSRRISGTEGAEEQARGQRQSDQGEEAAGQSTSTVNGQCHGIDRDRSEATACRLPSDERSPVSNRQITSRFTEAGRRPGSARRRRPRQHDRALRVELIHLLDARHRGDGLVRHTAGFGLHRLGDGRRGAEPLGGRSS